MLQNKSIYWIEYGIGGAIKNGSKVENASQAAQIPFYSIYGNAYSREADPFDLADLSTPSPVRDFQIYYYDRTIEYAKQSAVSFPSLSLFFFHFKETILSRAMCRV